MATTVGLRGALSPNTGASQQLFERAMKVLPGGTARNATFMRPYPLYARGAQDGYLIDVDGNRYLDLCLDGGSCIFGHSSSTIREAVKRQVDQMYLVSLATELEVNVAEKICGHLGYVESVRFLNSGSEACQIAARVARAFTSRPLVAMFEGCHHGQLDSLIFSHYSDAAGSHDAPEIVPDTQGLPPGIERSILMLPYNNTEATVSLLRQHASEIAAVMMEPMTIFAGAIPAEPDFLRSVRSVTRDIGAMLIFDEVPTGFRVGLRGMAGWLGVEPDLFVTGKALAGGLPVGMFGGRRDIMESSVAPPFNPRTKALSSGTFSGNPLVLATVLATLERLESGGVYPYLGHLATRVRVGIEERCRAVGVPVQVTGLSSVFGMHLTAQSVRSPRDAQTADSRRPALASAASRARSLLALRAHCRVPVYGSPQRGHRLLPGCARGRTARGKRKPDVARRPSV
jgi:glutamate-1-semialdehyde 2,1-aminomutase